MLCVQCVGLYVLECLCVRYIFIRRCAGAPCRCDQKCSSQPDACVGECVRVVKKIQKHILAFSWILLSVRRKQYLQAGGGKKMVRKDLRICRADTLNLVAKEASIMVVGPSCAHT